jgi:hypothetical protein
MRRPKEKKRPTKWCRQKKSFRLLFGFLVLTMFWTMFVFFLRFSKISTAQGPLKKGCNQPPIF